MNSALQLHGAKFVSSDVKEDTGRIRFQAQQSVKKALLAPWSPKTNPAFNTYVT